MILQGDWRLISECSRVPRFFFFSLRSVLTRFIGRVPHAFGRYSVRTSSWYSFTVAFGSLTRCRQWLLRADRC